MTTVRVRMYRHGLGNCFLISIPQNRGVAHVLIDCGVLKGNEGGSERMRSVAQSIFETTGGRVDALVVTHQRWDHVSGFLEAQSVFDRLEVLEVWLPWTEDSTDSLAHELTVRKAMATTAVSKAALQLDAMSDPRSQQTARRLRNLLDFHGEFGVDGQQTTAKAMEWVKNRPGARLHYLKPGSTPFESTALENLRVFILGPPRIPKMLRESDPSTRASEAFELAGVGREDFGFPAAFSAADRNAPDRAQIDGQPFDKWFRMSNDEVWDDPFFDKYYGFEGDDDHGWRRIESEWLGTASRQALQLESHTNNTSLALAFELMPSKRVFLFPGDAQIGKWLSWGSDWQHKVTATSSTTTVADILARTVLYKVGHHASYNDTLRELSLEMMSSSELVAMLPVDRKTVKKMDRKMPFPSLYRRLLEKTEGRVMDLEFDALEARPSNASEQKWSDFLSRIQVTPYWIDYWVPC